MRSKVIFIISAAGLLVALLSAFIFSEQPAAQPPAFTPASNPYAKGIYASGIIESAQAQGENINIYPEVAGPVTQVLVAEGAHVHKGDVLLRIDETVQRASTEQQQAQAQAAEAMLSELRAEPRPQILRVAKAQAEAARATLKNAEDQLAKQEHAYAVDPRSISRDALDNARNAQRMAAANLTVALKQYELTRAGAWSYDVLNQERQTRALTQAYAASAALLAKYSVRAPADGVVLALQAAVGSYVSPQGAYDAYTQAVGPLIVMGTPDARMQVRAYIDEILVSRLAEPQAMSAQMFIRGTELKVPLTFERIQPYVTPKIELSDERQERVDLRVLPVIFRFERPKGVNLYLGQLVDVYVAGR
jgi:HlyD family secretion protein